MSNHCKCIPGTVSFLHDLLLPLSVFAAAFFSSLCSVRFQLNMANMSTSFVDSFNRENGEKDGAITFDEAVVQVNGLKLNGPLTKSLKSDRAVGDVNIGGLPLRDMVDMVITRITCLSRSQFLAFIPLRRCHRKRSQTCQLRQSLQPLTMSMSLSFGSALADYKLTPVFKTCFC